MLIIRFVFNLILILTINLLDFVIIMFIVWTKISLEVKESSGSGIHFLSSSFWLQNDSFWHLGSRVKALSVALVLITCFGFWIFLWLDTIILCGNIFFDFVFFDMVYLSKVFFVIFTLLHLLFCLGLIYVFLNLFFSFFDFFFRTIAFLTFLVIKKNLLICLLFTFLLKFLSLESLLNLGDVRFLN